MAHVFPTSIGKLAAAERALEAIGQFLTERLTTLSAANR